jgi:hypothetical protein
VPEECDNVCLFKIYAMACGVGKEPRRNDTDGLVTTKRPGQVFLPVWLLKWRPPVSTNLLSVGDGSPNYNLKNKSKINKAVNKSPSLCPLFLLQKTPGQADS